MSDVAVVGGGLAGLAVSSQLNDQGHDVTLYEKRGRLGGRASSYQLDDFPIEVDNCQHILTGSCQNCIQLVERYVEGSPFEQYRSIPVLGDNGSIKHWNSADRFPPFHALSLLKKAASTTETFLKACIPLIGLRWASSKRYPAARDWLERYQPPDVVKRLWDPLTISALNESPDRLGLKAFKKWIFTGLTDYRSATDLKIPSLSLRSLYGDKLGEGLQRRGVDIQKHTRIKQIDPTQPSITIDGGETRSPDWVISALEDRVLWARLIEQARERDPFNRIPDWDHAPIVSVHLLYEKPLDVPPFALLPETPFEWMFALRQPEEYGYVQCVKSAAREASGREKEDLVREATESVSPLIPNENERINSRVVKEKNATLSMTAETTKQRFGPETPYENFLVAGDWTDCGWPPTMESAVRSGYRAAQKVDSDCPGPKPDPRPEGLLSLFSPVEM